MPWANTEFPTASATKPSLRVLFLPFFRYRVSFLVVRVEFSQEVRNGSPRSGTHQLAMSHLLRNPTRETASTRDQSIGPAEEGKKKQNPTSLKLNKRAFPSAKLGNWVLFVAFRPAPSRAFSLTTMNIFGIPGPDLTTWNLSNCPCPFSVSGTRPSFAAPAPPRRL